MKARSALVAVVAVASTLALGSCSLFGGIGGDSAEKASSLDSFGSMDDLIKAAKEEGEVTIYSVPDDWANYGKIKTAFEDKYGIKVNSIKPEGTAQDAINAAKEHKGTDKAPDVFDLPQNVALANTNLFADYQVSTWDDIPTDYKDAQGAWVDGYGGFMSVGYDSGQVPDVTSLKQLLGPEFKKKVALNGDPLASSTALSGVLMAAVVKGGSADDISPGVDYFSDLQKAGNFLPVDPSLATIESGQTPVVFDWDYLNNTVSETVKKWKVWRPKQALIAAYYVQAINAGAQHPAAARLWQEFLFSDEGQNLWLQSGARPARIDAMVDAGTADQEAYAKLPEITSDPVMPTQEQTEQMSAYLASHWVREVG